MSNPQRLHQIGIAASQGANAILGGWADESLSSRAWRSRGRKRWACMVWLIDAVFRIFGQRKHCLDAYLSEIGRNQLPPELRALNAHVRFEIAVQNAQERMARELDEVAANAERARLQSPQDLRG